MQLEPSDVQDREILDFRESFRPVCREHSMVLLRPTKQTFVRIEKLVAKLRD